MMSGLELDGIAQNSAGACVGGGVRTPLFIGCLPTLICFQKWSRRSCFWRRKARGWEVFGRRASFASSQRCVEFFFNFSCSSFYCVRNFPLPQNAAEKNFVAKIE